MILVKTCEHGHTSLQCGEVLSDLSILTLIKVSEFSTRQTTMNREEEPSACAFPLFWNSRGT